SPCKLRQLIRIIERCYLSPDEARQALRPDRGRPSSDMASRRTGMPQRQHAPLAGFHEQPLLKRNIDMDTAYDMKIETRTTPWSAVICMMLTSFTLVASEFMPVSLLTPIADELAITAGQAGQAISISGFFAVFTAL